MVCARRQCWREASGIEGEDHSDETPRGSTAERAFGSEGVSESQLRKLPGVSTRGCFLPNEAS